MIVKNLLKHPYPIQLLTTLTFFVSVTINGIGANGLIGTKTVSQVSNDTMNLFTPAGLTFSIWSLIYFMLLYYTYYQMGISGPEAESRGQRLKEINGLSIIANIANMAWIVAWTNEMMLLSVGLIILLLVTLLFIMERQRKMDLTPKEKIVVFATFSIYTGWITVATIANITALLVKLGFRPGGTWETLITIAILLVGIVITLFTARRYQSWQYVAVIFWAYLGILYNHMDATGFNGEYKTIIGATLCGLLVLGVFGIRLFRESRKQVG